MSAPYGEDANAAVAPQEALGDHVRPQRRTFLQWIPSDTSQLTMTEAKMLSFLGCRNVIQRMVAGLNTLSSRPSVATAGLSAASTSSSAASAGTTRGPSPSPNPLADADAAAAAFPATNTEPATPTTPAAAVPSAAAMAAGTAGPLAAVAPARLAVRGPSRHIIFLHGFGGGLAMWLPNMDPIIAAANRETVSTTVHFLDMPGFARSERHPKVSFNNEVEAMDYMTGKLYDWFTAMGLNRKSKLPGATPPVVDLIGHSFGAYVSASFAERYPHLVDRVVLCDPWGVPPIDHDRVASLPLRIRLLMKLFYAGNPFSLLRAAGPWGPSLLPSVRKDFADRWEPILDDPTIFFDYVYHCNALSSPTGEQAFQACCTGPAYARRPMQSFLHLLPPHVRVVLCYGANTWMDREAGKAMFDQLRASRGPGVQCVYYEIPNAGHQLNTDNIDGFNDMLLSELGFLPTAAPQGTDTVRSAAAVDGESQPPHNTPSEAA